jgi:uncharacterized protein (TIGR03435 family)
MKVAIGIATMATLFCFMCVPFGHAQSQSPARAEFEVASIKLHQGMLIMSGLETSGARVTVNASTVSDLIVLAYNVKDYQLAGVADWMRSDRYDVIATSPGESTPKIDQIRQMLQTLLSDRFRLSVHRETKEMAVYALVVGKNGPRLKEDAAGPGVMKFNRKGRDVELEAIGATIESLINQLPRMPGVDRAVLDRTGLTGKYDFRLTLTDFQLSVNAQPQGIPAADSEGASVFTALQEQLGLKLESQKAPVEILTVDRVERPSEN